jgi:tRNA nucleotidyltransferase/poly(A) polymerase
MSRFGMTPDHDSAVTLRRLSQAQLPTDKAALDPNRLRYERSRLLTEQHPTLGLRAALETGFLDRDCPRLAAVMRHHDVAFFQTVEEAVRLSGALPQRVSDEARLIFVLEGVTAWFARQTAGGPQKADLSAEELQRAILTAAARWSPLETPL